MSENNNKQEKDPNFYASDGRYVLVRLNEADKENYFRLLEQTNEIPGFYDQPERYEMMWKIVKDFNELDYSIYNEKGEYCGNILIKNPDEPAPEIGIDLVVEKRNQGIAASCIKLLARTVHKSRSDLEHFILRVSSKNLHSKHMIEKLGAELIGEEDTLVKRLMKQLEEESTDEYIDVERQEKLASIISKFRDKEDDEVVYRYKLTSNLYL